jgi:hypothetical protein
MSSPKKNGLVVLDTYGLERIYGPGGIAEIESAVGALA